MRPQLLETVGVWSCLGALSSVWVLTSVSLLLQFTAPSMASVLEQLNIINGILFIPLR